MMTTTLELPDRILTAIADRAQREARSVNAVIQEILDRALGTPAPPQAISKKLPVIQGRSLAAGSPSLPVPNMEGLKDLELNDELERYENAFRQ